LKLPEALITQLRDAIVKLDMERLRKLMDHVKPHDGLLAETIGQLLERFDFDLLGKLLGNTGQKEKENVNMEEDI